MTSSAVVALGQLAPLRVFRADGAGDIYLATAVRGGQRAGDVKPPTLEHRTGWSKILRGHFIAAPCDGYPNRPEEVNGPGNRDTMRQVAGARTEPQRNRTKRLGEKPTRIARARAHGRW